MKITLIVLAILSGLALAAVLSRLLGKQKQKQEDWQENMDSDDDDADRVLGIAKTVSSRREDKSLPKYIAIHVAAEQDQPFSGYELLQSLLSSGLRYGKMNIFHRHEQKTGQGRVLFSVASMTKPGTFDLPSMGGFSCVGLTLFFLPYESPDPRSSMELMWETANQLMQDLGGRLLNERHEPMSQSQFTELLQQMPQSRHSVVVPG